MGASRWWAVALLRKLYLSLILYSTPWPWLSCWTWTNLLHHCSSLDPSRFCWTGFSPLRVGSAKLQQDDLKTLCAVCLQLYASWVLASIGSIHFLCRFAWLPTSFVVVITTSVIIQWTSQGFLS